MPRANLAIRYIPAAMFFLSLAGCFNTTVGARYLAENNSRVAPQAPPPQNSSPAAPDMRIANADIPLVPLPPLPADRGTASQITQPPAQPAALPAKQPGAQPVIVPVAAQSPVPSSAVPTLNGNSIRQLLQQAVAAYSNIDSYIARLTRREQINGRNKDEEVILFRFRKQPWSVYFKWIGEANKGREVVFVKGQHGSQIHTLLAAGDHPLKPAGSRTAIAPDSPFVLMASRHSITEAGIGSSIDRLGVLCEMINHGDTHQGTLKDLGVQARPDYPTPLAMIEHNLPPGADKSLPRGGKRFYGFDTESHLPVLVTAYDEKGHEVEYYRYDRLQCPVKLDNDDFDPDKLWEKGAPAAGREVKPKASVPGVQ